MSKREKLALGTDVLLRTFIQIVLKQFLGVFRPFFLEVCALHHKDLDDMRRELYSSSDHTFTNVVWASTSMCHGRFQLVKNAMQSYPSGHTATAFTVGTFLALYLNSKTKAFADYQTGIWKSLVVIIPPLGAGLIAALLVIDGVSQKSRNATSYPW